MYPHPFDFKNPDYLPVFAHRLEMLGRIRKDPAQLAVLRLYYRDNPIDFIEDWGVTYDPRNVERGRPAVMPLILFPRQKEFLAWVLERWRAREPGLSDKSRDMGLTWMLASLIATLGLFNDGFAAGFGSRKEDLVDKAGDPDSIFYKIRMFISNLPEEFRGGWNERNKAHSSHMLITIPQTGAVFRGEAGDNIGRGGRSSIYCVDESAFLARPQLVDAALSQTTNCRIDISSVNGTDNPFADKRWSWPARRIFTFHWRDDPRKDGAWYEKMCSELNPLVVAQEIDLDYSASKAGVVIPSEWVQAAIDADVKLGIKPTGAALGALDVADEGIDMNAFAGRHGVFLQKLEEWSGKGLNIFTTTERTFLYCDENGYARFKYDSDGLGVGVRGDATQINERRKGQQLHVIEHVPFRGSGAVVDPKKEVIKGQNGLKGRTNEDFFKNYKAQSWWALRTRFENTYRAVVEGLQVDLDSIIVIPSSLPLRARLVSELSRPTYDIDNAGKIVIDKAPDGQRSPNLADAVMIAFAPEAKRSTFF